MAFVWRLKALSGQTAVGSALLVLPFLFAASSAQATAILPISGYTESTGGAFFTSTSKQFSVSQLAAYNNILGLKFYSNGNVDGQFNSEAVDGTVDLSTTGTLGDTIANGVTIPILFSFTLSGDTPGANPLWQLTFGMYQTSETGPTATGVCTGTGYGTFSTATLAGCTSSFTTNGSFTAIDPTTVFASFFISAGNATIGSTENFALNVPQNSWDFNPVAAPTASDAPEPASLVLLGSALAGLAFWARRK
jgi:hypothetical protein